MSDRPHPSKPTDPDDVRMSRRHLQERIAFNTNHAKEHMKAAKDSRKLLLSRAKEYQKIIKKGTKSTS